jgi:hypothetical protein
MINIQVAKTYQTRFGREVIIVKKVNDIYYSKCGLAFDRYGECLNVIGNLWGLKL